MGLSRLYGVLVGSLMVTWLFVLLVTHAVDVHGYQQADTTQLYACTRSTMPTDVPTVGVTLCDANPTSELNLRRDSDNLQSREGALVIEVVEFGISSEAGLQPGDVIYRVGGVDVDSGDSAADRLSQVNPLSDTIVNFLRQGRPYRVKLRHN
jgi:S1-C subfamily serine protease